MWIVDDMTSDEQTSCKTKPLHSTFDCRIHSSIPMRQHWTESNTCDYLRAQCMPCNTELWRSHHFHTGILLPSSKHIETRCRRKEKALKKKKRDSSLPRSSKRHTAQRFTTTSQPVRRTQSINSKEIDIWTLGPVGKKEGSYKEGGVGVWKLFILKFSEDSLGVVGRSEPTEFGRWVQWTSVLMAVVLGGGFWECNRYINSCMLSILGRIRATHRERGTRWSARDRRPFLPAR